MFSMYRPGMLRHGRPTKLAWTHALSSTSSSQDLACTIHCYRQEHAARVWQAMQAVLAAACVWELLDGFYTRGRPDSRPSALNAFCVAPKLAGWLP